MAVKEPSRFHLKLRVLVAVGGICRCRGRLCPLGKKAVVAKQPENRLALSTESQSLFFNFFLLCYNACNTRGRVGVRIGLSKDRFGRLFLLGISIY